MMIFNTDASRLCSLTVLTETCLIMFSHVSGVTGSKSHELCQKIVEFENGFFQFHQFTVQFDGMLQYRKMCLICFTVQDF